MIRFWIFGQVACSASPS